MSPAAYRLRRALALAVVVATVLSAWVILEAAAGALGLSAGTGSASVSSATSEVEVAPGDTFWGIASRLQPQGDPRPLVDRLVAAHGPGALQAGEHLVISRG